MSTRKIKRTVEKRQKDVQEGRLSKREINAELAKRLTKPHLKHLRASAISDEVILEQGCRSVTEKDLRLLKRKGMSLPFKAGDCMDGLLFVHHGLGGEVNGINFRPDTHWVRDGKELKYVRPVKAGNHLDVMVRSVDLVKDPDVPLVFTEGEKKAMAGASNDPEMAWVCVSGVWNWMTTNDEGGSVEIPELGQIPWKKGR